MTSTGSSEGILFVSGNVGRVVRTGYEISSEDFRRLQRKLLSRLARAGVPEPDRDDLIQDTLLHAQRALDAGSFRQESDFDTWVVGIAKKRMHKYWRARQAQKRSAVELPLDAEPAFNSMANSLPDPGPDPQGRSLDRELLALVGSALQEMNEQFRHPLQLSAVGHSYREIAVLLGITPNLVSSRLNQARAKLRRELSQSPRTSLE